MKIRLLRANSNWIVCTTVDQAEFEFFFSKFLFGCNKHTLKSSVYSGHGIRDLNVASNTMVNFSFLVISQKLLGC